MPGKHRKMRGGFSLGDYSNNASNKLSSGWASLSQGASDTYNKAKNSVANAASAAQPKISSGWASLSQSASDAYNKTKNSVNDAVSTAQPKISSGWASLSQGASNAYNKTKNAVRPNQSFGGRRRTRRSKRGGSFSAHKPLHGLAAHSSPVSNVRTAQPHHMVGGRSKRHRKYKHSRSCKH